MLETERLYLRQWCSADLEPFAKMNADPEVMRYFPSIQTKAYSQDLIERVKRHIDEKGWGWWAVEQKSDGAFVGALGLMATNMDVYFSPCVEIGWRLNRQFWGKGLATEAANRVVQYAFEKLQLPELVSFTSVCNVPSIAVMKRIGMSTTPEYFEHPLVDAASGLKQHVLYRLANPHNK